MLLEKKQTLISTGEGIADFWIKSSRLRLWRLWLTANFDHPTRLQALQTWLVSGRREMTRTKWDTGRPSDRKSETVAPTSLQRSITASQIKLRGWSTFLANRAQDYRRTRRGRLFMSLMRMWHQTLWCQTFNVSMNTNFTVLLQFFYNHPGANLKIAQAHYFPSAHLYL